MRAITTNAATQAALAQGQDPIIVIKIDWPAPYGTQWYGDEDVDISPIHVQGKLLVLGTVSCQVTVDQVSSAAVVSITLDDSDGTLKTVIDNNEVEYATVTIYQWFEGLTFADLMTVFEGNICGPIEWSEGQRTFKFDAEIRSKDLEVGFSADEFQADNVTPSIPSLNPEAADKAWPLCFGNVVLVPALKLLTSPRGHLLYPFQGPRDPSQGPPTTPYFDDQNFTLQSGDGDYFPQGSEIQVIIDGVVFLGEFHGDKFNVVEANYPKYQALPFGDRGVNLPTIPGALPDLDVNNPRVAWLAQPISIVNNWVWLKLIDGTSSYLRVIRQEGNKVWFNTPVDFPTSGALRFLGVGDTIAEVAKHGRPGWTVTATTTQNAPLQTLEVLSHVPWKFNAGTEVYQWGIADTFVANLIPSSQVVSVWAKKTNADGATYLAPIPTSYYQVNLNDTIKVVNKIATYTQHPTTVTFKLPLNQYDGQRWSDEVYVVLKSSVGPNVVDVISWLITTYSTLSVDATTFAAVKTAQTNYPIGFALQSKREVQRLVDEIAWQARCALLRDTRTIKIKYLSPEPSADVTLTGVNFNLRSINLSFTQTEDIVTVFEAQFKTGYYPQRRFQKELVFSNNVAAFGLKRRAYDFFIYNIESLVNKSATFWSTRFGNSWRLVRFDAFLEASVLEVFDCPKLNPDGGTLLNAQPKSIVQRHYMNLKEINACNVEVWLPYVAGSQVQAPGAWLSDAGDTMPADPTAPWAVTPLDVQLADEESKEYIYMTKVGGATVPAIVLSTPAPTADPSNPSDPNNPDLVDQGSGLIVVNEYANGYSNPVTGTNVIAAVVGPNSPAPGDKVSVYKNGDKSYAIVSAASGASGGMTPGITQSTGNTDGTGYTWQETQFPGGPLKPGTASQANGVEMSGSGLVPIGTPILVQVFGALAFFDKPYGDCS